MYKPFLYWETNQEINQTGKVWYELFDNIEEFQEILRILVDFENETKENASDDWLSLLRQALCYCQTKEIRIFIRYLEGYLFHIVAQAERIGGQMAVSWLHEDGIQAERDLKSNKISSEVHHICCMNDLYENHCKPIIRFQGDLEDETIEFIDFTAKPMESALNLMRNNAF